MAGYLSFIVFSLFLAFFILKNIKLTVKYFFIFVNIIAYSIGNMLCDFTNIYLVELGKTSSYAGAFCLLALFFWAQVLAIKFCDQVVAGNIIKERNRTYYYVGNGSSISSLVRRVILLVIFVISFGFWLMVIRRPAFLLGINRFTYSKYYMPSVLNKIRTIPILLGAIACTAYMQNEESKYKITIRMLLFAYLPFIMFAFWIGNKYGIFVQLIAAFIIPLSTRIDFNAIGEEIINKKRIIKIAFLIVVLLLVLLFCFWWLRGNSLVQIYFKLTNRITQGGELWWTVVKNDDWRGQHFSEFGQELSSIWRSIITKGTEKRYGVYRLMSIYGNSSYLDYYNDIDMRLAAKGFELSFYYFGILTFAIFPILYALLFAFAINLYIRAVKEGTFSSIVYLRMLFLLQSATEQGDWYRFLSNLDIMLYVCLAFDYLLKISGKRRTLVKSHI